MRVRGGKIGAAALCLCLGLCLCLLGCGGTREGPGALFDAFRASYHDLPAGRLYRSGAAEWEETAMPPSLIRRMYTEESGENAFSLCREYAVYLCGGTDGGEVAFLRCATRADAVRVCRMGEERIALVRRVCPGAAIVQGACVLLYGCDVVILLLPDNDRARGICGRLF